MPRPAIPRIVALAVAMCTACSFTTVGPRAGYSPARHGAPTCNTSAAGAMAVDGVGLAWGTLVTATMLGGLEDSPADSSDSQIFGVFAAIGAVGTALHAAALITSSHKNSACKKAHRAYEVWSRSRPLPPAATTPPGMTRAYDE